ncbi:MAG: catechol 2,3-dioxygenase-like lactoylglutathione lyase family enzyme [Myxococcota bacterium]|jgi:catechol 2,3-dioxygenase-like lactoylglutathione lyase family enzyme
MATAVDWASSGGSSDNHAATSARRVAISGDTASTVGVGDLRHFGRSDVEQTAKEAMMMHLSLRATDLDASVAFYTALFGAPPDKPADGTAEVASWMPLMVAALPERYREAVRLSELEGLSQAEVATRLGLSPSGARTRVQRGRKRLLADLLACCPVRFEEGVVVDTGINECACGP